LLKTSTLTVTPNATGHVTVTPVAATHGFERVYDEHVDFIWRSARRLGVSEAAVDDVVQRVFLVVHRRLAEFEGRSSLRTWLFSILLHEVREHRRSIRRKSPHWLSEPADPDALPDTTAGTNPDEALERAEASRMIDLLLDSLDEEKRIVFVMAELEQMSAAEIGQATGLDSKAVYSRLRAARIDFERAAARMRKRAGLGRSP
jgi:RNA polymerase sigma-70 factor (ECF subfamily)